VAFRIASVDSGDDAGLGPVQCHGQVIGIQTPAAATFQFQRRKDRPERGLPATPAFTSEFLNAKIFRGLGIRSDREFRGASVRP